MQVSPCRERRLSCWVFCLIGAGRQKKQVLHLRWVHAQGPTEGQNTGEEALRKVGPGLRVTWEFFLIWGIQRNRYVYVYPHPLTHLHCVCVREINNPLTHPAAWKSLWVHSLHTLLLQWNHYSKFCVYHFLAFLCKFVSLNNLLLTFIYSGTI